MSKKWDIQWPLSAEMVEAINANFDALFLLVGKGVSTAAAPAATSGGGGSGGALPDPVTPAHGGTGLTSVSVGGLMVGGAANVWLLLPVGPDGQVLTASSVSTGGVKWTTASGGNTTASYVLLGAAADLPNARVLLGTANQIIVTPGSLSVVLSTPQDLSTASTPRFAGLGLGVAPEAGSVLKIQGHAYHAQYDAGTHGGAITIDWANGNEQILTLNANPTFTFTNGKAGARYVLRLQSAVGGPYTPTWPGSVQWSGDVAPTLSADVDGLDLIAWYFDGTAYIGAGANASALAQGLPENPLAVGHGGTGHFVVAEGDLFVGQADGTLAKLAVSSVSGTVLTANPSVAGGVEWAATTDAARVACSVYISSDYVLNDSLFYKIEFDTEDWDVAGMHDNGNPTRITVPTTGLYLVTGGVNWSGSASEVLLLYLLVNGTLRAGYQGAGPVVRTPSWVFSLVSGDYVEVQIYQHTSHAKTIQSGTFGTYCQVTQVK